MSRRERGKWQGRRMRRSGQKGWDMETRKYTEAEKLPA